ncbi:sulfur carrier protein ThiS [Clostridium sp. UBA4548]|uniref:sulfur carrier protein ThiS n=1 Tax=Clostridium sp. UBA4548 TaxID=1946361 RepID=UPI0025B99D74|nr:sulfur carrier protein ThiS [Clostridium sp. UBA4548]
MIVNGKEMNFEENLTVLELLKNLSISENRVVVEVNYNIITKEQFLEVILNKEDKVEIVSFVGGG